MGLSLPAKAETVVLRSKTDMERLLPGSDPFLPNSALGAMVTANAHRVFDVYTQLRLLETLLMPDTTDQIFAERWGAIYGQQLTPATKSTGRVIATGAPASNIPIGTIFATQSGVQYISTATADISANSISVLSITRVGSIATAVCASEHMLSNAVSVTISGAVETEYNGAKIVTVVDAFSFIFEVSGAPITPASGTISIAYNSAPINVQSVDFQNTQNSVNVNLSPGAALVLQSPLVGVDNTALTDYAGIAGGTDTETYENLRNRTLDRIQNPVAHFSVSDIISKAKEEPGVTRVFVSPITPALGQVTIYFMRDNDDDPIPSPGEVASTKARIMTIAPATTSAADVFVLAPTANPQNFVFTSVTPNTPGIRSAIVANLAQFFAENTVVNEGVDQDAYRSAIKNTIDPASGDIVLDFVLSSPIGDVPASAGFIPTFVGATF